MGIFLWAFVGLMFFIGVCWFIALGLVQAAKVMGVKRQQRLWRRKH